MNKATGRAKSLKHQGDLKTAASHAVKIYIQIKAEFGKLLIYSSNNTLHFLVKSLIILFFIETGGFSSIICLIHTAIALFVNTVFNVRVSISL